MWELRTCTPSGVGGHLLVVVTNTSPLHRYYRKKLYLCLHCLRLSRRHNLYYNRLCVPSDGSQGTGGAYLRPDEKLTPGLRELVKGGKVVGRKDKSSACAERKRPHHGWPTPTAVRDRDD